MKLEYNIDKDGYPLDENGFLRLQLAPSDKLGHVRAHLFSNYSNDSPLVKNILRLLTFESGGKDFTPESADFDIPVEAKNGAFALKINKAHNNDSYADFALKDGKVEEQATHRRLIVAETQIIGRHPQTDYPRAVDYSSIITPTVDQHTHLSAQISGDDLMEMGLKHGLYYPTAILDKLGITYPDPEKHPEVFKEDMKRSKFLPYARLEDAYKDTERGVLLSALDEKARQSLKNAMGLTPEGQSTIEDMEKSYFHREPFTKNLDLLPDILHKVVASYKADGIKYTELSSNAVLDPAWLEKVHEIMSAPDMDHSVMIRFRPGLPRNLDDDALIKRIEQYKRIAASPYVAGPDILGFEMNKTSHLLKHLEDLADWMAKNRPDDSIQIHAGENSKNPDNVLEAIRLANTHNIRVLVGHAIYGISDTMLDLARDVAKRGKLMVQLNFASNMAGNNIDFPHDVDVSQLFKEGIPCLNNSDGAGFYYTGAKECAMMAAQCGLTHDNFNAIAQTEKKYIAEQQEVFAAKAAALPASFFDDAKKPLPDFPKSPPPPPLHKLEPFTPIMQAAIAGKRPLFFAGAGGTGWASMDEDQRKQFTIGFKLLLKYLDPEKVYFLKGRTKETGGIGSVMIKAIQERNPAPSKMAENPFIIGTLLADRESIERHGEPGDFTLNLPTAFVGLPSAIAAELKSSEAIEQKLTGAALEKDKQVKKSGYAICVGGKAFTRNFIEEFKKQGIGIGLMDDIQDHSSREVLKSASSSKARVYPENAFIGAKGMVKYIMSMDSNLFRADVMQDPDLNKKIEMDYKELYFNEMGIHPPAGRKRAF